MGTVGTEPDDVTAGHRAAPVCGAYAWRQVTPARRARRTSWCCSASPETSRKLLLPALDRLVESAELTVPLVAAALTDLDVNDLRRHVATRVHAARATTPTRRCSPTLPRPLPRPRCQRAGSSCRDPVKPR